MLLLEDGTTVPNFRQLEAIEYSCQEIAYDLEYMAQSVKDLRICMANLTRHISDLKEALNEAE
jgi:hypothetical protein